MIVIEFQDTFCRIFAWQSSKGVHTLKTLLAVRLEKNDQLPAAAGTVSAAAQRNGAAIRQALKAAGLPAREALAVVPKQWVTLRIVTLPSIDTGELVQMARFEAERHIPFNVERHVVSHHVLGMDGLQGTQVLIAALDGPPAWEISATMNAAGIHLTGLDVSTSILANALTHSKAWNADADPTVAQVNIGQSATDITILRRGSPIFSRSIALGVDKLAGDSADAEQILVRREQLEAIDAEAAGGPPEPLGGGLAVLDLAEARPEGEDSEESRAVQAWVNRLVQEIRRTHDFAAREFSCEPLSRIFLSGVGCRLRNLGAVLARRCGAAPVELDPFVDGLQFEPGATLPFPPSAYAVAAGALVRETLPKALVLNLLPMEYVRRRNVTQRRRSLTVTASLAAVFLVSAVLYLFQAVGLKEAQLKEIEKELDRGGKRAEQVRYRKGVVRILKSNSQPRGSAQGILNDLSGWGDLFGPDTMRVSLTEFDYTAGKKLRLTGQARSHKDLNDLVVRLEKSGHFGSVLIESRPQDPTNYPGGVQLIRYTVNCDLEQKAPAATTAAAPPAAAPAVARPTVAANETHY